MVALASAYGATDASPPHFITMTPKLSGGGMVGG